MISAVKYKFGRFLIFSILLMGTAFSAPAPASLAQATEGSLTDYDQQALYTVKLGKSYVEWPTVTSADGIRILNICILGDSPNFLQSLAKFQSATASSLKINISNIQDGQDLAACNILYIPKNKSNFKTIINNIKNLPVLTLSPISGFANSGGIIEFAIKEVDEAGAATNSKATVSLIINNRVAMAANIKIAPELLENAEVIR